MRAQNSRHCNITGLSGIHFSSDLVMLLDTCGLPSLRQDPAVGFLGLAVQKAHSDSTDSTDAKQAGTAQFEASLYSDAGHLTGGFYRLCWCAAGFSCSSPADFRTDFGEVYVTGIVRFSQHRTCVSGQTCSWSGIELFAESTVGQLIVLDTCAANAERASLPNGALVPFIQIEQGVGASRGAAAAAAPHVLFASWGETRLGRIGGGTFQACWCDSSHSSTDTDCSLGSGSGSESLASVNIIGPSPFHQHRTVLKVS